MSMYAIPTTRHFLIAGSLCLATLSSALAQNMVSIKGSVVNMREGPGTNTPALWELSRGYPLKVIKRQGRWVQVSDFENDIGWVSRSLTSSKPYHVVKAKVANVRQGPGTTHPIVGKAEYGELVRTREKRPGWVRVERDGGQLGWIAKKLLWGW